MASSTAQSAPVPEAHPTTLVAIGPWERGEFAIVGNQLRGETRWTTAPDIPSACQWVLASSDVPAAFLLAQPLPRTYDQAEIESLRQIAPLAQIVTVAGTWCEGEFRTGKPLAGTLRLYWYELEPWWRAWRNGHGVWSAGLDGPIPAGSRPLTLQLEGLVAIHTSTHATFSALAGALALCGMQCCWVRDLAEIPSQLTIGIWDGGQLDPSETIRLQDFAAKIQQADGALVVLLDFPRKEHSAWLEQIGCRAFLGKPYRVADLLTLMAANS